MLPSNLSIHVPIQVTIYMLRLDAGIETKSSVTYNLCIISFTIILY